MINRIKNWFKKKETKKTETKKTENKKPSSVGYNLSSSKVSNNVDDRSKNGVSDDLITTIFLLDNILSTSYDSTNDTVVPSPDLDPPKSSSTPSDNFDLPSDTWGSSSSDWGSSSSSWDSSSDSTSYDSSSDSWSSFD
jgi:hypothetical protein